MAFVAVSCWRPAKAFPRSSLLVRTRRRFLRPAQIDDSTSAGGRKSRFWRPAQIEDSTSAGGRKLRFLSPAQIEDSTSSGGRKSRFLRPAQTEESGRGGWASGALGLPTTRARQLCRSPPCCLSCFRFTTNKLLRNTFRNTCFCTPFWGPSYLSCLRMTEILIVFASSANETP